MRIAYIGGDAYANCAMALLEAGHTLTHVFRQESRRHPAPVTLAEVAKRAGVRVRKVPVARTDIERAIAEGAEAILCAVYPWRLPITEDDTFPAVNLHPSPLPEGRGPAPYEWAILTGRTETAVTIHQIVEKFDAGPIVAQRALAIRPDETANSLAHRCAAEAEDLAVAVFADFGTQWAQRKPQGAGTYCKLPRRGDRTLDWRSPGEMLHRQLRAFPPGRRYGVVGGKLMLLGAIDMWEQPHAFEPGTLCASARGRFVIATLDGFVEAEKVHTTLSDRLRRVAWPVVKGARAVVRR